MTSKEQSESLDVRVLCVMIVNVTSHVTYVFVTPQADIALRKVEAPNRD